MNFDEDWKLLEKATLHGRTLICWINPTNDIISIFLFNMYEPINAFSRKCSLSQWGWPTYFVTDINSTIEASQVVSLYLQDFEKQNYWWEEEGNPPNPPRRA